MTTVQKPLDVRPGLVRSTSVQDFQQITGREEQWRFTPLRRLGGLHDGTFTPGGQITRELRAPTGVTGETVPGDDPRVGCVLTPFDRVSAQAWESAPETYVLSVPSGAELSEPVRLTVTGQGGRDAAAFGHTVIDIGRGAEASVVLDHRGTVSYADNVEVSIGDNAGLMLVSIQDWDGDAVHVSHQKIRLGRDARLRHIVVTLGGSLVRMSNTVEYADRGGDAELLGLYFADSGQHQEHRLVVEHTVPDCRSRVEYRGALQGEDAHAVWVGDVIIRAGATGTDTYELNRNLVLTDGARADSIPNLEIETGEVVGAGHASATGRFDDEQLFYLQSRGIPEHEARRLVVRGFFASLLARIGDESVSGPLMDAIEVRLTKGAS
ncbi:MAG: Fe-S cluster assembly protein SufD [Geodermatophilaceae bacterium]|nr:Fe-S cluster assembly protein SufD [Geodermatophilaceae bacterium]MDQ3463643.1 Fe-S cluster assembly protein SufD [Actinomycetota bacterium]